MQSNKVNTSRRHNSRHRHHSNRYADDLASIAWTATNLQTILNALQHIKDESNDNNKNDTKNTFTIGEKELEIVQHFKHLGIDHQHNAQSSVMTTRKTNEAKTKTYAQIAIGAGGKSCSPLVSERMWTSIVLPSLLYGTEVYSPNKTQLKAMETAIAAAKSSLGLPKNSIGSCARRNRMTLNRE